MELKKIRYFLEIVDQGSLSKAARSLYLTQPTLSRFLQKLESEVGAALFEREKNGTLVLTEAGQVYLKTARQIDALCSALDGELARLRRPANQILLGISGDHLQEFAAACADKVMAAYPQISVRICCDGSLEIQQQVAQGMLDLGVVAFDAEDRRLRYLLCDRAEMNLVVAKVHPLARQQGRRLRLEQLGADTAFALMREKTVLRRTVDRYLQAVKYVPQVKQTYMRHGSIVKVLTDGHGLAGFCPANNRSEKLAYLALDPPFYYCQGICISRDKALTPPEEMLVSLLQKQSSYRNLDR